MKSFIRSSISLATILAVLINYSGLGYAASPLPVLNGVEAGNIILATSGNTMNIKVEADRSIGRYSEFNVDAGYTVNINHDMAGWTSLHRVMPGNPSSIFGNLNSNGKVFLINPDNLLFGAGSVVDMPGLVASTLDITNADFIAGVNKFSKNVTAGSVTNNGNITISNGGYLALLAPQVSNTATITADTGKVLLASGEEMTVVHLDTVGDISATITKGTVGALSSNSISGTINVGKGAVVLTAKSLNMVLTDIVNNSGVINAVNMTAADSGTVELSANRGSVNNSGTGVIKAGDVKIDATKDVNNSGSIKATRDVSISGRGTMTNDNEILGQDIKISATGDITNNGRISTSTALVTDGGGHITNIASVPPVTNSVSGLLTAPTTGTVTLSGNKIIQTAAAASLITNALKITARSDMDIRSAVVASVAASVGGNANFTNTNHNGLLINGFTSNGTLNIIQNGGNTTVASRVQAGGDIDISALTGDMNINANISSTNGKMALYAQNDIVQGDNSVVYAKGDLNIIADSDNDGVGDFKQIGDGVTLGSTGASGNVTISGRDLWLRSIFAKGNVTTNAARDVYFYSPRMSLTAGSGSTGWWGDSIYWTLLPQESYGTAFPELLLQDFASNWFLQPYPNAPFPLMLPGGENISDLGIEFTTDVLKALDFWLNPIGTTILTWNQVRMYQPDANTFLVRAANDPSAGSNAVNFEVAFHRDGTFQINYLAIGGIAAGQDLSLGDNNGHSILVPGIGLNSVWFGPMDNASHSAVIDAGGNAVINAGGGIIDMNGGDLDVKAGGTITLTATSGVGSATDPIETSASNVNATNNGNGNISIINTTSLLATVNAAVTGTGNINFAQQGGGDLYVQDVNAANGGAEVSGSSGADVILGLVRASGTATVNSGRDILDEDLVNEPYHLIADRINLNAVRDVGKPVFNGDIDYQGNSVYINGTRVFPSDSAVPSDPTTPLNVGLTNRFMFPHTQQLMLTQVNPIDRMSSFGMTGPVYFYHPITDVNSAAYDGFELEQGAYDFIDGQINPVCSEEDKKAGRCEQQPTAN